MDLAAAEQEMARLDAIAKAYGEAHKVEPGRGKEFRLRLMEAGRQKCAMINKESVPLMESLLRHYAATDAPTRAKIRKLLARHRTFTWCSWPRGDHNSAEAWRMDLLSISACDQFSDSRDTIIVTDELTKHAIAEGIDIGPILDEVAALSSDDDTWPRSTRQAMLDARARVPKR